MGTTRELAGARSMGAAAAASVLLMLVGCAQASAPTTVQTPVVQEVPAETPSPTPEPEPELSVEDVAAWAADAEWSYAPDGLDEPYFVQLTGGTGTDDLSRAYELGDPVEADVDGDGVVDAAIPITLVDGNAVHELWYVWRGLGLENDPVAEQVVYPLARTTRCGDVTRNVAAIDGGLQIDVVLRMPYTDDARSCADGGTGELTRTIRVEEIDGDHYPVQVEPIAAWGGVCPPSEWLDGLEDIGISGRAAPAESAPVVTDPSRSIALYSLRDAPLVKAGGASFFGFVQEDADVPVKMHCAFAD